MSQIQNNTVKEWLYNRYITPTTQKKTIYSGIEIELPIVNLRRTAVDFEVVHSLTNAFYKHFNFNIDKMDDEGNLLVLISQQTGDIFTFDCSYNTLEFSLGKIDNLNDVDSRLTPYLSFVQSYLQKHEHTAVGLGTNPYREYNNHVPIKNNRYQMLFHHLSSYEKFRSQKPFFPYPAFGMFTAASQIQLDVLPGKLLQILKVFNLLEPFKSVLFANSILKQEGLLLSRDKLWSDSMQGFNPCNVGMHEPLPATEDEFLEYLLDSSVYCTERDGKYYNFTPIPIREYFKQQKITAEYFTSNGYITEALAPTLEDLLHFRTFKFQDPTFRGTVEFRSVCTQPIRERLTTSAFHLGMIESLDELDELLTYAPLYKHGLSAAKLRELLNKEAWPDFIDYTALKATLLQILSIAQKGLKKRGKNEEIFLTPLFNRAERLLSPAREYTNRLLSCEIVESVILDYAALY